MTDLNDHIEYVQRHPRERAAARALVDRIAELPGRTIEEALRAVADYVVVARNVHAVVLATRICRKGARYLHTVQVMVFLELGEVDTNFNIIIVGGWQPPIYSPSPAGTRRDRRRTPWVRVGARWIIVALRNYLRGIARIKAKLRREKLKATPRRSIEKFKRSQTKARNTHTEYHT